MKKLLFYLAFCFFSAFGLIGEIIAQVPESFLYQAEARNSQGKILKAEPLLVKVSILQNGLGMYEETHSIRTDENGLFSIRVGEGESENDNDFSSIDWSVGQYFLNVKVAVEQSDQFIDMGTTQLLSVPYALFAQNAGNGISSNNFKFYYPDEDGDGFGDENKEVYSPVMPDNYITAGGDCDDNNADVNPNAEEVYDGIDNNCDGKIDEGYHPESVTIEINGFTTRNVLNVSYSLHRSVDSDGQPTSKVSIDGIYVRVKSLEDGNTEFFEWMCSPFDYKDGKIVIRSNGNLMKQLEFKRGYIISYKEKYDDDEGVLIEEFEISPQEVKMGGASLKEVWAEAIAGSSIELN